MMLKYFEVSGFRNFNSTISLDFSHIRDYQFNHQCIKNGLVKSAIIYGKNASGKTNFGLALFDIVSNLTSNNVTPGLYDNYMNIQNNRGEVAFRYVFQFGKSSVEYSYVKTGERKLISETVVLSGEIFLHKDYLDDRNSDYSGVRELAPTLNFTFLKEESVLRYVLNNTAMKEDHPLYQMMDFVSNMLWFRSLDENRFIGYKDNARDFGRFLLDDEASLAEFQSILERAGIPEVLTVERDADGRKRLYASRGAYSTVGRIPFYETASSGTRALYTYFYWRKTSPNLSLLFIDEFDAYYHFELAETMFKELQNLPIQVITTSHNTNLLSNRIMRPDCYFVLNENKLTSVTDASWRELREGHNLEKLYLSGDFDE